MIELWIILSFIPAFIYAVVNFMDKFLITSFIKRESSFLFYTNLLLLPALILLILINGFQILKIEHMILGILSGSIIIYSFIFYGKALKIEETTKVVPLFSLMTIFTLLFDITFLKENISFLQIIGIFVILFGSLLITSKNILSIFKIRKVLIYMIICDLLLAFSFISIKYLSNYYNFLSIQIFITMGGIFACLSFLLLKKEREEIVTSYKKFSKKTLSMFILNNFLDLSAAILLNFIFTISVVSLTTAILNVQYVFIFILGIILSIFFPNHIKEHITKKELFKKLVSISLILSGIFLIIF